VINGSRLQLEKRRKFRRFNFLSNGRNG